MIQPRLPVIPSAARNLKSITTRPVSQCHVYVMTNSGKQRENSPGRLYVVIDILDSSTPLAALRMTVTELLSHRWRVGR